MSVELTLLSGVAFRGREIGGPRLRGLVALLAADLRAGAGIGRLVDGLWPDEQPENPTKALQVLVFRARSLLGSDVLVSTPTGYRLALSEDQVDASAVAKTAAEAARAAGAGDHVTALATAEAGLAHWTSAPFREAPLDDPLAELRAARAATYDALTRARALALARLGRTADAVGPLAEVLARRPRDEEVLLELLRCEAATAGPAEALRIYDDYRRSLRDELGTDPGAAVRAEHQRLLQGDAPAVRRGVLNEPNPLLGRDKDVAAVSDLLRSSRVTSIVGPGGLGKTRLANVVSRQAPQRAVHVVALAGLNPEASADDVAAEVASALGVAGEAPTAGFGRAGGPQSPLSAILGAVGGVPTLLVLDNCEHVIDGVAELAGALVSGTAELTVLTTSRTPLGLSSESVYPLPELSPDAAVELFGQRARAARPDVALPTDVVVELCRHLDGLPLAVELAAARVRVMSVAEIARGLDDRFALLRGGPRDAPERHRTLGAVVDWSWDLLDPADQAAMRALSIFPEGFATDAAGSAAASGDILSTLERLVDHSLLKVVETPAGTRFRMLETVREFAAEHRERAGETDAAVDAFLAWARDLGRAAFEPILGPDPMPAVRRVQAEQDNLAGALRLALERGDDASTACVAAGLGALWSFDSNYTRLLALVGETERPLSRYRPEPEYVEVLRASATVSSAATFMMYGGRITRSLLTLRRLPPAPPDTLVRAIATVLVATPTILDDDKAELRAFRASDQPLLAAVANAFASYVFEGEGDAEGAITAAEAMLEALRGVHYPWLQALGHSRVAELTLQIQRADVAEYHLLAALSAVKDLGHMADVLKIRWALVLATLQRGDLDAAEHWLAQTAVGEAEHAGGVLTFDLAVRAEIALARGNVEAGLRRWRETVAAVEDEARRGGYDAQGSSLQYWSLEVRAATVIAHARHGKVDLVEDVVDGLTEHLSTVLAEGVNLPLIAGALLLALGTVDIDHGGRSGDRARLRSGVRLVALAERFYFVREFQPTMSPERAREAAEDADRSAYDEAVSTYADLDSAALREAALVTAAGWWPPTSARGRG